MDGRVYPQKTYLRNWSFVCSVHFVFQIISARKILNAKSQTSFSFAFSSRAESPTPKRAVLKSR